MGLIEMIDVDAINYLSNLSDESFQKAMKTIEENRRTQEEARKSKYNKEFKKLCEELKADNWIFQCYDCYTEEWYDFDFDYVRIRRKKD